MHHRCHNCGYQSPAEDFRQEKTPFGRRWFCTACRHTPWPRHEARYLLSAALWLAAIGVIVTISAAFAEPWASLTMWLFLAGVVVFAPLMILVHEGAHALAAWAVGATVGLIRIGSGPILVQRRIGETILELRRNPTWSGCIVQLPIKGAFPRMRGGVVDAAGPVANLLVSAACLYLLLGHGPPDAEHQPVRTAILLALALSQALGGRTLIPEHYSDGGASDGEHLRQQFVQPAPSAIQRQWDIHVLNAMHDDRLGRGRQVLDRLESALALRFEDNDERTGVVIVWLETKTALDGASIALARVRQLDPWLESSQAPYVFRSLSDALVKTGDPACAAEALAHADHAIALNHGPNHEDNLCRGHALVAAGRWSEGLDLLIPWQRQEPTPLGKAGVCAAIAQAERALGRPEQAARQARLETWLLDVHERRLGWRPEPSAASWQSAEVA